jgi:uncharacterized Fe-S center protein
MNKVYLSQEIEKIISQMDYSKMGNKVAIKVHFGEEGCDTYINPDLVKKVYQKIESLGKEVTLVECNVLYKGSRTNATDHIATAKKHGFTDMKIDILDGEMGDEFVEIKGCKLGRGIEKYDSMIVLSHFKGHMATGFGGAIKNVGMGLGSRAGKLDMHSGIQPIVSEKCTGCGECATKCNFAAIEILDGRAVINEEKCEGCAMCISVCPIGAMEIPWTGRTPDQLQERIVEYTSAVLEKIPNTIYVNVVQDITELCDCMGAKQKPMMEDVGILFSDSIVSIERASLDLVNKISGGKFEKINQIDKDKQIKLAEELGPGDGGYELTEL